MAAGTASENSLRNSARSFLKRVSGDGFFLRKAGLLTCRATARGKPAAVTTLQNDVQKQNMAVKSMQIN